MCTYVHACVCMHAGVHVCCPAIPEPTMFPVFTVVCAPVLPMPVYLCRIYNISIQTS